MEKILNDLKENYSDKQLFVLKWWSNSACRKYDGIICDGAIRSGKTTAMSVSFIIWAMSEFNGRLFGICGKTITSLKRNVVTDLISRVTGLGMKVRESVSKNYFDVYFGERNNRFYLFGGKDAGSAALIQGITLAGILMDEAALMPRSFVEQAIARCSVSGSKLWFNCNPDNPYHWFKKQWIDKAQEKNILYIHFCLSDNPSLSERVISRYHRLYTGAFYRRFVLGQWSAAEGLIYPMFQPELHTYSGEKNFERFAVSCDYGTVNPSSFGLWGKSAGVWYRIDEYYYDSRREGERRTDEEHYQGLCSLIGNRKLDFLVVDPSAASFMQCINRHGVYTAVPAKNDVVSGIRLVSDFIKSGKMKVNVKCADTIREFSMYRWDEKAGTDCPVKENDHAMDDIRYFVTALPYDDNDGFLAISVER